MITIEEASEVVDLMEEQQTEGKYIKYEEKWNRIIKRKEFIV